MKYTKLSLFGSRKPILNIPEMELVIGRYFVLQVLADTSSFVPPPPPGSLRNEACVVCIIPAVTHPNCASYSYTVRACLIVTVHGSISCTDPLRPARRSTYLVITEIPLVKYYVIAGSRGLRRSYLHAQKLIRLMQRCSLNNA